MVEHFVRYPDKIDCDAVSLAMPKNRSWPSKGSSKNTPISEPQARSSGLRRLPISQRRARVPVAHSIIAILPDASHWPTRRISRHLDKRSRYVNSSPQFFASFDLNHLRNQELPVTIFFGHRAALFRSVLRDLRQCCVGLRADSSETSERNYYGTR